MFDVDRFLGATGGLDPLEDLIKSGHLDKSIVDVLKSGGFNRPSMGDVHTDQVLTNLSLAFMQDESAFVARQAFRSIPVRFRSDVYYTYPRGEFNRNQMKERAPGTESAGANYDVEQQDYRCKVFALHRNIPDQIRDNADSPLNLDRETTQFLTMKGLLQEEIDWRDKFFGGTGFGNNPGDVWTFVVDGDATPTALASLDPTNAGNNQVLQWSATPGAGQEGPIETVRRAMRVMQAETGFRPNIMVMGREVIDVLKDHPDILGRIDAGQTPGGPADVTMANIASLFDLEEIIVMDAIVNTAKVGAPAQHGFIGGKNALLLYRPASAGLMTPAPGYNFLWTGFRGANGGGTRIKNFRVELIESDRIEIQSAYDHRLVAADLGFYFNGIVA